MSQQNTLFDIYDPKCVECGSRKIVSLGRRGDRRKYACKDCQTTFLGEIYTRSIKHREFDVTHPKCVFCQSKDLSKHSIVYGKQRYFCRSCERHFRADPTELNKNKPQFNPLNPKCIHCDSSNLKKKGVSGNNKQIYFCKDCSRKFYGEFCEKEKRILAFEGLNCPKCNSFNIVCNGVEKSTKKQKYFCNNCGNNFVENSQRKSAKNILPDKLTVEEMFNYDIWDVRILGLTPTSNGSYTLNFSKIQPQWLKIATKEWVRFKAAANSAATLVSILTSIKCLSSYIQEKFPFISPQDIDRSFIVQYLSYLTSLDLAAGTKSSYIGHVKHLLEDSARFNWIEVTKEQLVYQEDYPKQPKSIPRYIPDNVLEQIKNNYDKLPNTIVNMIEVLLGTGIRTSELVNLKINCVEQDSVGDYWIKVYQLKMMKEISLIISKELVKIIQEQQDFIRKNLREDYPYLFCETKNARDQSEYKTEKGENNDSLKPLNFFEPKPIKLKANTLRAYLHRFADEIGIKDENGQIFPLGRLHRFRHTHGTELINNGVPQHIVQQRLGHDSPRMTSVYAHIHDQTMKKEMEKFWDGKIVNNQGHIVISENPELDTASMQWIKRNMKVQSLPDGFCGLPITQDCPVQGSPCLSCSHFRTSIEFLENHKKRLKDTEKIIENARVNGWSRQVETNLPIANNLKKIIRGLEEKEVVFGDEQFPEQEGGAYSA